MTCYEIQLIVSCLNRIINKQKHVQKKKKSGYNFRDAMNSQCLFAYVWIWGKKTNA